MPASREVTPFDSGFVLDLSAEVRKREAAEDVGAIEIDDSEILAAFEIRRDDLERDAVELVHLFDRHLVGDELVDPLAAQRVEEDLPGDAIR
jgi:hypothetical protein